MLNEIQEAHEYMCDISRLDIEFGRLKWKIFNHNADMNGLERMLTTIARFFIFEEESDNETVARRKAEAAIRMWLGFSDELEEDERLGSAYKYVKEKYPQIDSWLENYLKEVIHKRYKEDIDKFTAFQEQLNVKNKQFKSKSLQSGVTTSDFKLIRYDKIIANAKVARGPLKMYYLACADSEWTRGTYKTVRNNPNGALKHKDEDKVLKLVASYLLERGRKLKCNSDYVFEAFNFTDYGFWAVGGSRYDRTKFEIFTYEDSQSHNKRPLFEFRSSKSGNLSKVRPNVEWMGYCGWEIIDATENDDKLDELLSTHPNAVFFSDKGACSPLQKGVRYTRRTNY